jgi:hypothetical protein
LILRSAADRRHRDDFSGRPAQPPEAGHGEEGTEDEAEDARGVAAIYGPVT